MPQPYNNRSSDKHIAQLEQDIKTANTKLDKIYSRLFEDNGKLCMQTTLEKQDMRITEIEKEYAEHKKSHEDTSNLIKQPLISSIIAALVGGIIAIFGLGKFKG